MFSLFDISLLCRQTPLHAAVIGGHKDVVQFLLEKNAFPHPSGSHLFFSVVLAIDFSLSFPPSFSLSSILFLTTAKMFVCNFELFEDIYGNVPLAYAIEHNQEEIIRLLTQTLK
jgi:ankyrin repeat protein